MGKGLYIGIYTEGSTSKMRADTLQKLLPGWQFDVIDTDIPFNRMNRLTRSIGFRYKTGPLINAVNKYIKQQIKPDYYDVIWIDKAVFIKESTTGLLRQKAGKLVHFTPDTIYYSNISKLFNRSIKFYDFVITTKSFELWYYERVVGKNKVISITQGFDSNIHRPYYTFENKTDKVVFVGLCEPARERIIQQLINQQIRVTLAGKKWGRFVKKNRVNKYLEFLGTELIDHEYAKLLSSGYFSLGLLSKRFPELHTTRTFEIPACGTALLTEINPEITTFYTDAEVIYFKNVNDLIGKIKYYQAHHGELRQLSENGTKKVNMLGTDYETILRRILERVMQ